MEGREARPLRVLFTASKRKRKATTSPELSLPVEEAASRPSLDALMVDLNMFEAPFLKDLEEEVIATLVFVYGKVIT